MQILRNSLTGQNKSYETMEDFPNISMASRKEVSQLCPRDRSSELERKCVYEDLTQIKMPGSRVIHQHSQDSKDGKPLIREQLTSGPPISQNPQKLTQAFFHSSCVEQLPGLRVGADRVQHRAGCAVTPALHPAPQCPPLHIILTIPTTFLTAFGQQATRKEKRRKEHGLLCATKCPC